jgi:uncharacterized membrane protein YtjA (UPF0391 family)
MPVGKSPDGRSSVAPCGATQSARSARGAGAGYYPQKEPIMTLLKWAAILAVLAIVAAIFGFGGIAEGLADIALILFYIFLAAVVVLVIAGLATWKKIT